ncbi:glycosyltransferase [Candidatus Woesearchaeota archaeon]|nr:MAG: glycosyltransferase [Candidatus Woesearchaeota archaeon]
MDFGDTTVIIPTLNEEKNIGEMLRILDKLYPGINIIVSDDGSKDKTQDIVRNYGNPNFIVLDRSKQKVKGLTIRVIDAAKTVKTEFIVVTDADMQHPPEKIKEIIEKLRNGYNIVIGCREKILAKWPWHRKLMSKTAIILGQLRLLLKGIYVKDVVSGFFGVRSDLFKEVISKAEHKFEPRGYKVLFDLLKQINRSKKIGYVNYQFGLRKRGESKISRRHVVLYFKSLFK